MFVVAFFFPLPHAFALTHIHHAIAHRPLSNAIIVHKHNSSCVLVLCRIEVMLETVIEIEIERERERECLGVRAFGLFFRG